MISRRKVYIPQPRDRVTVRDEVNIWDNEYQQFKTGDRGISESEEWAVLDRFGLLERGKRALEAGCGDGSWAGALQNIGMEVFGVDFSFNGLKALKRHFPRVAGVLSDVKSLPFPDRFFDLILSWGVLEHFEKTGDIDTTLRETSRCLCEEGTLVVSVPYLSVNRTYNLQVVSRRLASRVNWLRKIFGKGRKIFFQWEYKTTYFEKVLIRNGWAIKHRQYIWLDLGLRDDFRGLYRFVKYPLFFMNRSKGGGKIVYKFFAAFMLFVCVKNNSGNGKDMR